MKDLLDKVIEYYLSSPNFNGLPIYCIENYDPEKMQELISQGMVEAIHNSINPHIKHYNRPAEIKDELEYASGKYQDVCFYPTPLALISAEKDEAKPYTKLLQSGRGQYEVRYFDVEVLEQYFNNPQYIIFDSGYMGTICIRDEYEDGDMIQNYGMAYPAEYKVHGNVDRAIAVFMHDLAQLSEKSQQRWKCHEKDDQAAWRVNGSFIKNLVLGEWVETSWIYTDLLKEQEIINQICDAIGISHIFSKTWNAEDHWSRPDGYRTILFPTRKNYYEFVSVLEKITCNTISTKAFTREQKNTKSIIPEENEGSISMLGRWLKANNRDPQAVDEDVIKPLKKIRKIRQTPAHEVYENMYDKAVYKEQNQLIEEVFQAIHALRIMLGTHPLANQVKVPEYLVDEERIVVY